MTAKNDITGDNIKSKLTSNEYRDNWDLIFGKKKNDSIDEKPLSVNEQESKSENKN